MIEKITKKVYLHRIKEIYKNDYSYYCFDNDQSRQGYTLIAVKLVDFEVDDTYSIEKKCVDLESKIERIKEESKLEIEIIEAKIKTLLAKEEHHAK